MKQGGINDPLRGHFTSINAILEVSDSIWTGTIDSCRTNDPNKPIFVLAHDYCSGISCPSILFYRRIDDDQYSWEFSFSDQIKGTEDLNIRLVEKVEVTNASVVVLNKNNEVVKKYSIESLTSKLYSGE